MKRNAIILLAIVTILCAVSAVFAWETQGKIYGTDIEFAELTVSRDGVTVRLSNTYTNSVKISLRLNFYDKNGNTVGYSIFGLREVKGDSHVDITNNYLTGKWRDCRDAVRIEWQLMTHEILFE